MRAGISVVYQELSLASGLNVLDNVFLGQEYKLGPFVRKAREAQEVRSWFAELGVTIDPEADLLKLSNAELQVIEIVKALRTKPKLLILDEPTASLTEREAAQLSAQLLSLKKSKLPLLYVTHRLSEVFAIADRVSVLRGGKIVLSARVSEVTEQEIVSAIAGRNVGTHPPDYTLKHETRSPLVEARGLTAPGIGPVDFHINKGEILGVFGLVGSGRTELLETLFGARALAGGEISLDGKSLSLRRPSDAVRAGIALVPEDRLRKSVFQTLTAGENVAMASAAKFATLGFRRKRLEQEAFHDVSRKLNLQPRRTDLEARRFSGGNQQKLVLGRWLQEGQDCRLLLLDEPTQGVDVGARGDLYNVLSESTKAGLAVVVTSSEPEELMQLAHRVVVLSRGQIAGILHGSEINQERLLHLAHVGE
jgi:ribose transport system ATP-binding protein